MEKTREKQYKGCKTITKKRFKTRLQEGMISLLNDK